MLAFLDFEASSLGKRSYPIEVAWVFEDGSGDSHLIRPAPEWTDWDEQAAAIHRIARQTLFDRGTAVEIVATEMIAQLSGHDLVASAPSWDGKWMSTLLRAAGRPRHSLRLRGSEDARRECAQAILETVVPAQSLATAVEDVLASVDARAESRPRAHRALADAEEERQRWLAVRREAEATARRSAQGRSRDP